MRLLVVASILSVTSCSPSKTTVVPLKTRVLGESSDQAVDTRDDPIEAGKYGDIPGAPGAENQAASPQVLFQNPVAASGADPWVIFKDGFYYWCWVDGDATVFVVKSKLLQDIGKEKAQIVWKAPPGFPYSKQNWAPELHFLDGKWYIYVAATSGDNVNHRMFALEGQTADPQGAYSMKGEVSSRDKHWAIDGTVFDFNGTRYFIWSGWSGSKNIQQNLYIAPMSNPWSLVGAPPFVKRIEAEDATLRTSAIRATADASGGRVVGKIDLPDSGLEFQVTVPSEGLYAFDVTYANGSLDGARQVSSTQGLIVNGANLPKLVYPFTGWENYQTVTTKIKMNAGLNTIRLAKGDFFAEIDVLEVKTADFDRVAISVPTEPWERLAGPPSVNEGPQILTKDGVTHIIYSASGSWSDDYCLGQLTFVGTDPMDPNSWKKVGPVFKKTGEVFGTGHASFTTSPDGKEDWIVYHAAKRQGSGWDRDVRIQKFGWKSDLSPDFGVPLPVSQKLEAPSQ